MRTLLFTLTAGVLALTAAGAPAQAKEGAGEARIIMKRFAECVVKRQPELAAQFVLKPSDERMPERDFRKLVSPGCLSNTSAFVESLRMPGILFRGALAEELIRREMTDETLLVTASIPPQEWSDPAPVSPVDDEGKPLSKKALEEREKDYAAAVADVFVGRLGECVVRADPAGARAAVLTRIDTPEELAAMKAMSDTIASCVTEGQTLKFNRASLRAALATSYYLLGAAARAAQPLGTAG